MGYFQHHCGQTAAHSPDPGWCRYADLWTLAGAVAIEEMGGKGSCTHLTCSSCFLLPVCTAKACAVQAQLASSVSISRISGPKQCVRSLRQYECSLKLVILERLWTMQDLIFLGGQAAVISWRMRAAHLMAGVECGGCHFADVTHNKAYALSLP